MAKFKVLVAPDKYKGSLEVNGVCQAIHTGLLKAYPNAKIVEHPMADGGDGSIDVLNQHLDLVCREVNTVDPLYRPISAYYLVSRDGSTGFIELAKASGLSLLREEAQNPMLTSTFGTGILIKDALQNGCTQINLFLGGSATNDGGMGIATALGFLFKDANGKELKPIGANLKKVSAIEQTADFKNVGINLLCDVTNPLLGLNGAAHIYAPQKGADEKMISDLESGMFNFSKILKAHSDFDVRHVEGCGAAGGTAASLLPFFHTSISSGLQMIIQQTDLEVQIEEASVVISGEGRLDRQSFDGKVISGISALCKKHKTPLILLVGKSEISHKEQIALNIDQIHTVADIAKSVDDAIENAAMYLEKIAASISLLEV